MRVKVTKAVVLRGGMAKPQPQSIVAPKRSLARAMAMLLADELLDRGVII